LQAPGNRATGEQVVWWIALFLSASSLLRNFNLSFFQLA
jgi:hypothetical protein